MELLLMPSSSLRYPARDVTQPRKAIDGMCAYARGLGETTQGFNDLHNFLVTMMYRGQLSVGDLDDYTCCVSALKKHQRKARSLFLGEI
jgi:hypothetical protein